MGTHDPATMMLTSARKYGWLFANNQHDTLFGLIEYGEGESTSFRPLAASGSPAVAMNVHLNRWDERSARMDRLMRPVYGCGAEARLMFRDRTGVWERGVADQPRRAGVAGTARRHRACD
ncbi:hypothetical protein [Tsukamurella soli]|uniref:hypothetical protein n=1 Tax=Tsukamurella soli TaxID=644556 RepID=UPI0031ECF5A1